jgi:D-aminopeptidase
MNDRPRPRDLGLHLPGTPGEHNAITDVPGVRAGHTTLIEGEGARVRGHGPVRTGVTVVVPRPAGDFRAVFAATSVLNGTGELTGAHAVTETGLLYGPIALTNANSVGVVRDTVVRWLADHDPRFTAAMPVVGETWDGRLNDIDGFHVAPEHVVAALEGATGGAVAGGAVGAGTGTIAYDVKGGIGTASRRVGEHMLGALVQTNQGSADQLLVDGVPVGRALLSGGPGSERFEAGSIVMLLATDAPLLPDQLARLGRRAAMGLARTGSTSGPFSGDFTVAFSTADAPLGAFVAQVDLAAPPAVSAVQTIAGGDHAPLMRATVEVVEEAILDSLFRASTMRGADDLVVPALDLDAVARLLRRHGRLPSRG